jgi:hypothetical protein
MPVVTPLVVARADEWREREVARIRRVLTTRARVVSALLWLVFAWVLLGPELGPGWLQGVVLALTVTIHNRVVRPPRLANA